MLFITACLISLSLAIPPPSFVGELTNLPTITQVAYCTEAIDGKPDVLHEKTGASCTYNTVRPPKTSISAPKPTSSSPPPPSGVKNSGCFMYRKKMTDQYGKSDWRPHDREVTMRDCEKQCSGEVATKVAEGHTAAWTCAQVIFEPQWQNFSYNGDVQLSPGECKCNDRIMTELADWFVGIALPAIGEVTCQVYYTAIKSVLQLGTMAIPGLGQLTAAAATLAMQAAETIKYSVEDQTEAAAIYEEWLNSPSGSGNGTEAPPERPHASFMDDLCGNRFTPPEALEIFGYFDIASGAIAAGKLWAGAARSFPPPWAQGQGSKDDIHNFLKDLGRGGKKDDGPPKDQPKSPEEPKATPPTKGPEPTNKPETTRSKQCTKKVGRRAPGKGDQKEHKLERAGNADMWLEDDCEDSVTSFLIGKSEAKKAQAITRTCSGAKYPQACAHYYSAIKAAKKPTQFVCEDNNHRNDGTATDEWEDQHTDRQWRLFTKPSYDFHNEAGKKPACQRDEWPPAYFMPSAKTQREKAEWGQLIRWLPGAENGGAANSMWASFCDEADGGKHNGQRQQFPKRNKIGSAVEPDSSYNTYPFNRDLVDLQDKDLDVKSNVKDGTTTYTSSWAKAVFTRATFDMVFDWSGMEEPSAANDWLLRKNPCWPEDITDDPGYVLLETDDYYQGKEAPDGKYKVAPPQDILQAAYVKRPELDTGAKRPAPDRTDSEEQAAPQPNPKGQKPPSKRLELVDDRLMIRDDTLNTTRPLSNEEVRDNVHVVRCADRHCSKEKREIRDEDEALFVPGAGPPSMPSVNIAVPTMATQVVPHLGLVKRTPLTAALPLGTAAPE